MITGTHCVTIVSESRQPQPHLRVVKALFKSPETRFDLEAQTHAGAEGSYRIQRLHSQGEQRARTTDERDV
eukprot:1127859-Pleurochrysis_carterae.AAC.3